MYFDKIQMHGVALALAAAFSLLGFISAQAVGSKDLFRCRQSCYQKVGSLQIFRLFLQGGVKGEADIISLFTQKLKSTKFDDTKRNTLSSHEYKDLSNAASAAAYCLRHKLQTLFAENNKKYEHS